MALFRRHKKVFQFETQSESMKLKVILILALGVFLNSLQAWAAPFCAEVFADETAVFPFNVTDTFQLWPVTLGPEQLTKLQKDFHPVGQVQQSADLTTVGLVTFVDASKLQKSQSMYVGPSYKQFETQLTEALAKVFKTYIERQIIPANSVEDLIQLEKQLPQNRSVFIVATNPISKVPLEVIRIFDASPNNKTLFKNGFTKDQQTAKLPIEIEYPHITLEERTQTSKPYLIELGRLIKAEEIQEQSIEHIWAKVALFLWYNHEVRAPEKSPTIYIEATAVGRRLYTKYGFVDAHRPEELGIPNRFIMKMSAFDFVNRFIGKDKKISFTPSDQDSNLIEEKLAAAAEHSKSSWISHVLPNEKVDTTGLDWGEASRKLFPEKMFLAAKSEFENHVQSLGGITSEVFWNDYAISTQNVLLNDPQYRALIHDIGNELSSAHVVAQYGLIDLILPLKQAYQHPDLKYILNGVPSATKEDFRRALQGPFKSQSQQIQFAKQDSKQKDIDAIYLNQYLFRAGGDLQARKILKNLFSKLKSNGKLILQEPTPLELPGGFAWYTGSLHTLQGQSLGSYTDLYFSFFAPSFLNTSKTQFTFFSYTDLKNMAEEAGFIVERGDRVLQNSQALFVLRKP
jgi:hypothetical protein